MASRVLFVRPFVESGVPHALRVGKAVRPLGWCALGTAVLGWIVGVIYGWLEVLTIATCAGFLVVACAMFLLGKTGLDVRIDLQPQRTTVGLPANGQITVKNATERRLLPSRVDLQIGEALASFSVPSLGPDEAHDDIFRIGTDRRGIVPVGPARIVRAGPVGLFARIVSQSKPVLLYVHPKTVPVDGAGAGFFETSKGENPQTCLRVILRSTRCVNTSPVTTDVMCTGGRRPVSVDSWCNNSSIPVARRCSSLSTRTSRRTTPKKASRWPCRRWDLLAKG